MPISDNDILNQRKQIDALRAEFERLNLVFFDTLKRMGLTEGDLKKVNPEKESSEVKKLLEEAEKAAKLVGEARVAAVRGEVKS